MSFELRFEEFPEGPALTFARVPWDSELLGLDVVELRLREEDPAAAGAAVAEWLSGRWRARERARVSVPVVGETLFAYCRTDVANVPLAEELSRRGFYPVELTYEVSLPLHRLAPVVAGWNPRARLRAAEPSDLPALRAIAGSAFQADRYHLDRHISSSGADSRYSSWIGEAAAAGEPIFVYEDEGGSEVLGFFHWRSIGRTADLSLAAVHPRLQGTGVGASMYEAVMRECRSLGYDRATTRISAANLDVVNLFARLGFSFRSARLTWHFFASREGENR